MSKSIGSTIVAVAHALLAASLLAANAQAQDKSIGDLQIWYDETPISIGTGKMVWKGKVSIPLIRDAAGKISGSGSYPASNVATAEGCTSTCKFTTAMSVAGTAQLGGTDLTITASATTAACRVQCPKGAAMASSQHQERYTDKVFLPFGATQPVKKTYAAGGPAQYYQLQQQCDAEPDVAGPIDVTINPAGGKWTVTRLTASTLADVRNRTPPNPQRFGYTSHDFKPSITPPLGKSKPARGGDGFCYWVPSVTLAFAPIEVAIPGIDYPDGSCESKAIAQHEEKHVKLYQGLLSKLSGDLRKAVQGSGLPRASAPLHVKRVADGEQLAQQKIDDVVATLQAKFVDQRVAGDARIDSAAEYSAVKAACPRGWR